MDPKREPKITKILSKALYFRIRFSVDFANTSFVEFYYLSGCPEPPKCSQNAVLSFKIEGTTFSPPNRFFLKMGAKMAPRMTSQTLPNFQKYLPEHLFKKTQISKAVLDIKMIKKASQNRLAPMGPGTFFCFPSPIFAPDGTRSPFWLHLGSILPFFGTHFCFILAPGCLNLVTFLLAIFLTGCWK